MVKNAQPPELAFQAHIADYLVREHGYGVLEQTEITDTENYIAEDHLWAFLQVTQADLLQKLAADYGTDARAEVFRALRREIERNPLWLVLRNGLKVRGLEFRLFYPAPRSTLSVAAEKHRQNRITFRPHFYFGDSHEEIDFVFFLNGLPIVVLEVKHEKNQNVHDAVAQFVSRDHAQKVFQHPFLYLAADTSDVMATTDPRRIENFRWHNTGLANEAQSEKEYPVEFLYREVLSKEQLLEALSFFLIYVPKVEATTDNPGSPEFSIFPRYHQSRMVRQLAMNVAEQFSATGEIGRKYLINHSAGSGKTLSICWLADRLHSLYDSQTDAKLTDIIFILTDRKSLDKNIKDDIEKFTHLKDVVGLARKAEDLPRFLVERKPIIVTTQQKFAWILEEIEKNKELKQRRVAFLIDEAHRSQEGQLGAAIRMPFRNVGEEDVDEKDTDNRDEEESIAEIIRQHDSNQLFVAFTATPAPATLSLFGVPFDTYSEAEAIAEGYIVDVAASIISYKTLYHLHCPVVPNPGEERLYPAGVISKALKNVAYQDEGLIQYKAEVMLRIFEKDIKPLIHGRAKAMIVTSSRVAGLRYFNILSEKLRERGAEYKVLYAFSDFVHPDSNETVSEHAVNALAVGELIEDRFDGDEYRLMVVANKFQTGFNQPLLAGMFLDKPVVDRNAVQTISRLNRSCEGKTAVVVVDFTNNAQAILKAFAKYRNGSPFVPEEPEPDIVIKLLEEILTQGVFTPADAVEFVQLRETGSDAQVQSFIQRLRQQFQTVLDSQEERKAFVYLLARFVKSFHFLTCFFTYPDNVKQVVALAEYVGPQLIKQGTVSEMMQMIRQTQVVKAAVDYQGEFAGGGTIKRPAGGGKKGDGVPVKKVSVQDMIDSIRTKFAISDEQALYIREVMEEKVADPEIHEMVQAHRDDRTYLEDAYRVQVNGEIQKRYDQRGLYDELVDPQYTDVGGIFDIMAISVIKTHIGEYSY